MATDPRNPKPQTQSTINLEAFAKAKIQEVIRRKELERTNYQEPDDTCDCDDFVTDPPNPPVNPRRRRPPKPPVPPRPPVVPPPLPPPPVRFQAPQLPNPVPPFIAPPPIIFPPPVIVDDGGGDTGGTTEPPTTTTTEGPVTTEGPPTTGGGDDVWESRIPCCGFSRTGNPNPSDTELSLAAEESTHSGEFRNGCYPMCGLEKYREFLSSGAGFCNRQGIQICQCIARNNPSNPCYQGNGQVSPPGASLTTTSMFKKELLPTQYPSPAAYYADRLVST